MTSKHVTLTGAVLVALISTTSAYLAMVGYGIDVLQMSPPAAFSTAGVFELSLVTVALLAREAAKQARPGGVLLTLTWMLSSISGGFAAWHEAYIHHPAGAAAFRFIVPLLAALMWHLALIGDRHLATGRTWTQALTTRRMHRLLTTTETAHAARLADNGSPTTARRAARATRAQARARAIALRTVPPEDMATVMSAWVNAAHAITQGTTHLLTDPTTPGFGTVHVTLQPNRTPNRAPAVVKHKPTTRPGADKGPVTKKEAGRAARLAIVSEVIADNPEADSATALSALREAGHTVTDRTARRDIETVRSLAL